MAKIKCRRGAQGPTWNNSRPWAAQVRGRAIKSVHNAALERLGRADPATINVDSPKRSNARYGYCRTTFDSQDSDVRSNGNTLKRLGVPSRCVHTANFELPRDASATLRLVGVGTVSWRIIFSKFPTSAGWARARTTPVIPPARRDASPRCQPSVKAAQRTDGLHPSDPIQSVDPQYPWTSQGLGASRSLLVPRPTNTRRYAVLRPLTSPAYHWSHDDSLLTLDRVAFSKPTHGGRSIVFTRRRGIATVDGRSMCA